MEDDVVYVVTITEGLCVTQRDGDTLEQALVGAMIANQDNIPGRLPGVFLILARALRDVWDSVEWEDECGEDAKFAQALWEFLRAKGDPGYGEVE